MANNAIYDMFYKRLFSRKVMIRSLLEDFVPLDIVRNFDFDDLELFGTEFVSEDNDVRRADLVWRTTVHGEPCYIYIMTEFQSTRHRAMPLRMLEYTLLLWRTLENSGALCPGGVYPHVLPIVLYNGDRPWKGPTGLSDIIGPGGKWPCDPVYEYVLLDEKRIPPKLLERAKGPAAALISGEQARTVREFINASRAVNMRLAQDKGLFEDMMDYLARRMQRVIPDEYADMMDRNKRRQSAMLMEMYESFTGRIREESLIEGRVEGRMEGRVEGRAEGRTEGRRESLLELLSIRFGPVRTDWLEMICSIKEMASFQHLTQAACEAASREQFSAILSRTWEREHSRD